MLALRRAHRHQFTSVVKAGILLVPIILGFACLLAYFGTWARSSTLYPYANRMADQRHLAPCGPATLTPESNWLLKAIAWYHCRGQWDRLAVMWHRVAAEAATDALLRPGHRYGLHHRLAADVHWRHAGPLLLQKRFPGAGAYTPVLLAGYSCGVGLVGMLGVALGMIASRLPSCPTSVLGRAPERAGTAIRPTAAIPSQLWGSLIARRPGSHPSGTGPRAAILISAGLIAAPGAAR